MDQGKLLAELLRPLSKEEYEAVPVLTREQFREALRKGADELRQTWSRKPKGRW